MQRNRRRHNNQVPIRALSPWLIIAVIALVGGMTWVYFKNQLVMRGKEVAKLEKQLKDLIAQNGELRPRIIELSSRTALQKRLNDGFIKMIPIEQSRVVQVSYPQSGDAIALASDEIRAVSNPNLGVGR